MKPNDQMKIKPKCNVLKHKDQMKIVLTTQEQKIYSPFIFYKDSCQKNTDSVDSFLPVVMMADFIAAGLQ